MEQLKKRNLPTSSRKEIYAYEYDENLIPNEGAFREINQSISDGLGNIWNDVKAAVAHVFQDSKDGKTTATAAAVGYYTAGPAGAVTTTAAERGYACVNCHVTEPVSNALVEGLNFVTTNQDTTNP